MVKKMPGQSDFFVEEDKEVFFPALWADGVFPCPETAAP